MRYALNDLLEEEDVAKLSGETFEPQSRHRHSWRRLAALAACAVLVVGALNFGSLAAGVQSLWRYVTGVGAAEVGSSILVQDGPHVWELDGRTFTLSDAYEKDGVLSLSVQIRTESVLNGEVWFGIVLLEDGKPCKTIWGDDAEYSITSFWTEAERVEYEEQWGYLLSEQYRGGGSFAGCSPSFYTSGSGNYTVEIRTQRRDGLGPQGIREPLTAALELVAPDSQSFREHTRAQDGGTLTALVGEEGRRISFFLSGADNGLSLRCPYDIWFVDTAGNRYRGAMISRPAGTPSQSVEVRLETELSAPIASIEVGSLLLCKYSEDGSFLGYEDRPDIDWKISLQ